MTIINVGENGVVALNFERWTKAHTTRRRIIFGCHSQCALQQSISDDNESEDAGKIKQGVVLTIEEAISNNITMINDSKDSPVNDAMISTNGLIVNDGTLSPNNSTDEHSNDVAVNGNNGNQIKIVASGDGKLPLPKINSEVPFQYNILQALDSIYQQQSRLDILKATAKAQTNRITCERRQLQIIRQSLEDSGFELLNRRDLDLCNALNAGYLLGLSLDPDLKALDASIADDFFSTANNDDDNAMDGETANGGFILNGNGNQNYIVGAQIKNSKSTMPPLLFDNKVLIFRRGYGQERTDDRLIIPKIDYLQANIVQRGTAAVTDVMESSLQRVTMATASLLNGAKTSIRTVVLEITRSLPDVLSRLVLNSEEVIDFLDHTHDYSDEDNFINGNSRNNKKIKLLRYGGSSRSLSPDLGDRLNPFLLNNSSDDMVVVNNATTAAIPRCEYDEATNSGDDCETIPQSIRLLDRVSIENIFSPGMKKRSIVRRLFSKSDLVEPTYEEVVVIWRPAPPRKPRGRVRLLPKPTVPKLVRNVAEIFDMEYVLPPIEPPPPPPELLPFETRVFEGVTMANICAVLPKTKLVFRPADALRIDSISGLTLVAILANQKFDNPRLDLIALVSVSLWILRTFFRYSNKLARYDLLVKKFLTSKIAQKNTGAVRYITAEGGTQRARRAALIYSWMLKERSERGSLTLQNVVDDASVGIQEMMMIGDDDGDNAGDAILEGDINVDVKAALMDLEESNLIQIESLSRGTIEFAKNGMERLREQWIQLFDAELGAFSDNASPPYGTSAVVGERLDGSGKTRTSWPNGSEESNILN
eukprot:CAMPEP_0116023374 /NCGR_PEP_ID=MMETSP0321-20121206/11556_1 /TAXON_ID=163516 /ORGANISM="Leptocylindrus danicus var. danicus, Strain B650" /LENGTH=819 /DNA_ID=CAMNT_0003494647 /DNA_START=15 /DNA_END=2474 /DNA_ORIENTATION=-